MAEMKGTRVVTDRFSLRDLVRKHTPQNGRNYIAETVLRAFTDKVAVERMKLGEMYGYYGHQRREHHYAATGSLRLPEMSVIIIDGKPVTVDNVPAARTLDVKLDGDVVTHRQEILNTSSGEIVNALEAAGAGGWSWAVTGNEGGSGAKVTSFEGFDFVQNPNFISLDRQIPMMESARDRENHIINKLREQGFTENGALDVAQHFEKLRQHALLEAADSSHGMLGEILHLSGRVSELEEKRALFESVTEGENNRREALQHLVNNLPLFVSQRQRDALMHMQTAEDMAVVTALFESALAMVMPIRNRGTLNDANKSTSDIIMPIESSDFRAGSSAPKFKS